MWLIQMQMQNAATDKIHELKTDVISIQAWAFALLPGDAPHLWHAWQICRTGLGGTLVQLHVCSLPVGVTPIDQISTGLLPKPQTKNGSVAIRLKSEEAVGDLFHLNRESGVSNPFLLQCSGVWRAGRKLSNQTLSFYIHFKSTRHLR